MKTDPTGADARDALIRAQEEVVLQAKREYDRLKQLATTVEKQIATERKGGKPEKSAVEAQIADFSNKLDTLKTQLKKGKGNSKKRKKEIDHWKLWYNGLAEIDKEPELMKLQHEIAWRSEEIAKAEKNIASLYEQIFEVEGKLEAAKQQLQALAEGVYDLPLKKDPRILSIVEARNAAKKNVTNAEKALAQITKQN